MEIVKGRLYFIKDEFFDIVDEQYLKINKQTTKRPHYYTYKDKNGLLWVIPCSSQIDKYRKIIDNKKNNGKPYNHIQIVKVNGIEQVLLYQDMFPILEKYIDNAYIKLNHYMEIQDKKKLKEIEKNANNIINKLRHGVKFTPTQPDINKIEKIMLKETKK